MPISVSCVDCDKRLKVKDEAAGKKIRCPGCGGAISIPVLDNLEDFEEEDDFLPRKSGKSRHSVPDDEPDFGDDDSELDDDFAPRKSSSKSTKSSKSKPKKRRGSSADFLTNFYEGRLSEILAYCFWAVLGITWMGACTARQELIVTFVVTVWIILTVRGLITTFWWAKICSQASNNGAMPYIAFFVLPPVGLIYALMHNSECEKPNRLLMFSIGIGALAVVAFVAAVAVAVFVLGVKQM